MTPSNGELRSSPVAKMTLALVYKLQQRKSINIRSDIVASDIAFCRGMGAAMPFGRSSGMGRMLLLEEKHIFRRGRVTSTVESLDV